MAGVRDVVIDPRQCFDAFALKALMRQPGSAAAMLSDEGLKQNVEIKPAGPDRLQRTVSWNFAFPVVATDESTIEELQATLQALLDVVGAGAQVAWGSFTTAFAGAGALIAQTLGAGQRLASLWDDALRPGIIGCGSIDVSFVPAVDGQAPTGFVGYALMLESRWVNGAVGNEGNHGFTTCQEMKVNGVQKSARGVNSSKPASNRMPTDVYRFPVFAIRARPITKGSDEVSYQILSQVHSASGSFGNFNTQVQLRVVVDDSAEEVNAAIDELVQVAVFDLPGTEADSAVATFDEAWRIDVPATLVASNADARRLLTAARQGRVVHLGSHLGRMGLRELQRIAVGLQVDTVGCDRTALARRVAEKVAGGAT